MRAKKSLSSKENSISKGPEMGQVEKQTCLVGWEARKTGGIILQTVQSQKLP